LPTRDISRYDFADPREDGVTEQRSQTERRAPRWLAWVNPINRFLLQRGIGPPAQHLLTTTGRKSGRPRTTPVAVLAFEGERYLVAGFDGSDWVKNARATGRGRLQRGHFVETLELMEVPPSLRAAILQEFAQRIRGGQAFLTVPAGAPQSAFVEAAPRHPVFRLAQAKTPDTHQQGADRA